MTKNQLPKVVAINSMPAIGEAGLKVVMPILAPHIIPVPSLILSGIGNIKGHQRFDYEFEANLKSIFKLLQAQKSSIILYIGYLGQVDQIEVIVNIIHQYRANIQSIIVDPVCGDHGKAYVHPDIIKNWTRLLQLADWATPNITEVALLTGGDWQKTDKNISAIQEQYPHLKFIITSVVKTKTIANMYAHQNERYLFEEELLPHTLTGTGDAFTSFFILHHFIKKYSVLESIEKAGALVRKQIKNAIDNSKVPTHTNLSIFFMIFLLKIHNNH